MNDQQRAAMQMALEALEWYGDDWDEGKYKDVKKAQAALREALAQPQGEDTQGLIYVADVDMPEGFRPIQERIVELEQDPQSKAALDRARERFAGGGKAIEQQGEPVAWMRENEDCTDCFVWERDEEHTIPLYTTPPVVPQGEPVAWLDSDGFPWSKEGVECRTTPDTYKPLYTTPPSVEAAIEATKEKAAKLCEVQADRWAYAQAVHDCAAAIRSMK